VRDHLSRLTMAAAVAAAGTVIALTVPPAQAQAPAASGSAPAPAFVHKTPWGEPDLQGIWTDQADTPLERPAKYADQEFFTDAQRQQLNRERSALLRQDKRGQRGTEADVAQAYSSVFLSVKSIGARTSKVIDPPDGRIPPPTAEARKIAAADWQFRLALLQATDTCKNNLPGCEGGKYDPTPAAQRAERPPRYNTGRMNRYDDPEDGWLLDRCLPGGLPAFATAFGGSFRRIVQTPGGISMFYDVSQGQGWQRNIVMNGSPHLPAHIRQWFGDSRGHWEGDTLVVDVTNFSPKTDYRGSRENLHLIERWRRTGPTALEYRATIEDPTVWTRPWTVIQEFTKQSDEENRVYYEPRCIEGNYALPGMLHAQRMAERAFAEGRGPDPATRDNTAGGEFVLDADPLGPFATEQ